MNVRDVLDVFYATPLRWRFAMWLVTALSWSTAAQYVVQGGF